VRPGDKPVELISADFVEQRGRPGHEGLFPIEKTPAAGADVLCRLRLSGPVRDVRLAAFRPDGTLIRATALKGSDEEHAGPCSVPAEPFRLGAVGTDENGQPFRRVERQLR
jgi:hypothetical protein